MWRSKRPGRNKAGSMSVGSLVAATTTTPWSSSTPSISLSNDVSTFWPARVADSSRQAKASISSKNTIDGAAARALRKISRTARSLSPTYLLNTSGPLTAKKLRPDSDASALAASVLEQPGGPYNKTPLGAEMPRRAKVGAAESGSCTTSVSFCLSACWPAMSAQATRGISKKISRMADGRTSASAASKSRASTCVSTCEPEASETESMGSLSTGPASLSVSGMLSVSGSLSVSGPFPVVSLWCPVVSLWSLASARPMARITPSRHTAAKSAPT
ncbi:hypothetical protein CLUG_02837 [Clavispora lusitaniae ATCC 42720]|uniref:Uncharacterized protein n=1 Tax=Clavispora lusitaniae (strain ATCC 42720) TaxID=306902 RepID=C4Y2S4_CLAL4|nr:uncharacterized protein CLUG_02837 [Clavispora lusitaniae ATCC 42720]EEQ38710.1 hypothetical protein CLUG_02837 [Clavispora lusitaniae ATCC 42720]